MGFKRWESVTFYLNMGEFSREPFWAPAFPTRGECPQRQGQVASKQFQCSPSRGSEALVTHLLPRRCRLAAGPRPAEEMRGCKIEQSFRLPAAHQHSPASGLPAVLTGPQEQPWLWLPMIAGPLKLLSSGPFATCHQLGPVYLPPSD